MQVMQWSPGVYAATAKFEPLVNEKTYKLLVPDYIFGGGDGYDMLKKNARFCDAERLEWHARLNHCDAGAFDLNGLLETLGTRQ